MLKIRKTYKYRLYPNRKQRESLLATLEVCRYSYNDALQERREAWKTTRSFFWALQNQPGLSTIFAALVTAKDSKPTSMPTTESLAGSGSTSTMHEKQA
jgi:putative transposase